MIKKLEKLRNDMREIKVYSGVEPVVIELIKTLSDREEKKIKSVEAMQEKCRNCTSPHCGICQLFIDVVKNC